MRIVTVTLNPAIDMTVKLAEPLARGSVNLAESVTETPGGKGINVASFLADWGLGSSATGLIGADNVGIFEGLFREKKLDDRFVRVPGKTRTNVKIVDGDETTDVNLPGLRADASALRSLETVLLDLAKEGPCIVSLSGSLPKGCGTDIYANLTQKLRGLGARVMLDTSGEALKTALDAPVKPLCAKPNRSELAAWTGRTIETEEDLIRLGYTTVESLRDVDPEALYERDCALRGCRIDRCQLYVYRCAVYFASTEDPDPEKLKWWNWKDAPLPSGPAGKEPGA